MPLDFNIPLIGDIPTRKDILRVIKWALNGLTFGQSTTYMIQAVNDYVDPNDTQLPKFGVLGDPEFITVVGPGAKKDRVLRISIIGYTGKIPDNNDDLFLDAEDIADAIVNQLTSRALQNMVACKFSITSISLLIEPVGLDTTTLAFITIIPTIEFLDDRAEQIEEFDVRQ